MARKTAKNVSVMIPITIAVAGAAAALAFFLFKRKAIAAPPVRELPPGYGAPPPGYEAPMPSPKPTPMEQLQRMQEEVRKAGEAQKILAQIQAGVTAVTPTAEVATAAAPPPMTQAEQAAWALKNAEALSKKAEADKAAAAAAAAPTDTAAAAKAVKAKQEADAAAAAAAAAAKGEPQKKEPVKPGVKDAVGPLSVVTTVGKTAWAGISGAAKGVAAAVSWAAPVLIPLAIIGAIALGVGAIEKMNSEVRRLGKKKDYFNALASEAVRATNFINSNNARLEAAKNKMERDTKRCTSLVNALYGKGT